MQSNIKYLRLLIGSTLIASLVVIPPVLVAFGSESRNAASDINRVFSPVSGDDEETWIDDMILLLALLCALTNCIEAQATPEELKTLVNNFVSAFEATGVLPNLTEQQKQQGIIHIDWGMARLEQDPGVLPESSRDAFKQAMLEMRVDLSAH